MVSEASGADTPEIRPDEESISERCIDDRRETPKAEETGVRSYIDNYAKHAKTPVKQGDEASVYGYFKILNVEGSKKY